MTIEARRQVPSFAIFHGNGLLTMISTSGSITSPITAFLVVIKHVWLTLLHVWLTSLQSMSPSISSFDVSSMALRRWGCVRTRASIIIGYTLLLSSMALHLTYCHEEMVRVSADCQLESSVMTTIDSAKADPLCRNAAAMCIQNSTVESLN